jgi:hypothetical protein
VHHTRTAAIEVIRSRRWRCSWLYLMRACIAAEGVNSAGFDDDDGDGTERPSRCLAVEPPEHGGALGWGGAYDPANASSLGAMLFAWRCW